LSTPRYQITIETTFSASHQLRGYKGPIEPLHGHNFRVEASVVARKLDKLGLGLDFLELERELKEILAPYDHRHLNELAPFDSVNPTTENMARWFFEKLQEKLAPRGIEVRRIRVWEAPTYSASYELE
jgi:6-pyruvoyltetrahydropterin/6-carboxytetrahydropterin synthase